MGQHNLLVIIKRGTNLKQTMGNTNAFCQLKIGNGPSKQTKKKARYKKMIRQPVHFQNISSSMSIGSISSAKELLRDLLLLSNNPLVFYPKNSLSTSLLLFISIAYMDFNDQDAFSKTLELNGSELGDYALTVEEKPSPGEHFY